MLAVPGAAVGDRSASSAQSAAASRPSASRWHRQAMASSRKRGGDEEDARRMSGAGLPRFRSWRRHVRLVPELERRTCGSQGTVGCDSSERRTGRGLRVFAFKASGGYGGAGMSVFW